LQAIVFFVEFRFFSSQPPEMKGAALSEEAQKQKRQDE
jgi:hypothetical protein